MLVLSAGCAKFPAGTSATVLREMSCQITFEGPIDDNYYYFVPIDTTGGGEGPIAVFSDPDLPAVDEWVDRAATYYIQYHARQYTIYKVLTLHPFAATPIGTPLRQTVPPPGGKTLSFTIDLSSIEATGSSVDINIIAISQLASDGRFLDALGARGNSFVNIDISTDRVIRDSDLVSPEGVGDVLNQNRVVQPSTDQTNPLDIVDWVITTNV